MAEPIPGNGPDEHEQTEASVKQLVALGYEVFNVLKNPAAAGKMLPHNYRSGGEKELRFDFAFELDERSRLPKRGIELWGLDTRSPEQMQISVELKSMDVKDTGATYRIEEYKVDAQKGQVVKTGELVNAKKQMTEGRPATPEEIAAISTSLQELQGLFKDRESKQ